MELPPPSEVPGRKIRGYLANLRNALLGIRPVAGAGIHVSEYSGQGSVISLDQSTLKSMIGLTQGISTITLDVCVSGSPETHTFVITS